MKYGNLAYKIPSLAEDTAAAKDLYDKGELTQHEYNKKISELQLLRMKYIIATNGGYTPPKKEQHSKSTITDIKTRSHAQSMLRQREKFLEEIKKSEETPSEST